MNYKIKKAISNSLFASKDISQALIDLNNLSDKSDNEDRLFSASFNLEHARDYLIQAISQLNSRDLEISNEVNILASNFHTFLRKCCSGNSAVVLYLAIKNHPDQWRLLLANVTENIKDDDFDLSLENIHVHKLVELAETFDGMFELKAALEFFSLQNNEASEMLWVDLFK
jgi:hypothetical protein